MSIINEPFEFEFAGRKFKLKKANLRQIISFQQKVEELSKNKDFGEASLVSQVFAEMLFIALKEAEPQITLEEILEYITLEYIQESREVGIELGFILPAPEIQTKKEKKIE